MLRAPAVAATAAQHAAAVPAAAAAVRALSAGAAAHGAPAAHPAGAAGAPGAALTPEQKRRIDSMLRVDHAGEIGANYIYMGQRAVLGRDPYLRGLLDHMWEQEKTHLRVFDSVLADNRVRPSALRPLWEAAGFALGVGTAMLGKEAAMACTEAIETAIGDHYNSQIRELLELESDPEITKLTEARSRRRACAFWSLYIIRQFRDDELEHLETAVDHEAAKAPAYPLLTGVIKAGCAAAIWVASRV
ncbi:ubiquinone biosynthesis monooxygenase Coq7 [Polyrhizophydium stewartii]|uniref:5-demethoxyubiquinone hydroxylase, mitochondrial n=1 Tax=Polyrhizophydium stewartii TaxID=2732419 RepID=A0ABR4NHJ4_9FUNG